MANTGEIRRRTVIQGGAATAALSLTATPSYAGIFGKDEPGYLYVDGRKGDFDRLKSISSKGGLVGEDYIFKHGMPMIFPFPGEIIYAGRDADSWGRYVFLDSGIIQYSINHMDSLYVRQGQNMRDRLQVSGTQGRDGFNARGYSHVRITVIGNMDFTGDSYFNQLDEIRFYDDKFNKWNHIVDARKLRADVSGALFERPYNPETDGDLDDHYLDFVANHFVTGFADIGNLFFNIGIGIMLRYAVRNDVAKSLVYVIN